MRFLKHYTVSQGSPAMSLRYDGKFCSKFCAESSSERMLKIDWYFATLWTRVSWITVNRHENVISFGNALPPPSPGPLLCHPIDAVESSSPGKWLASENWPLRPVVRKDLTPRRARRRHSRRKEGKREIRKSTKDYLTLTCELGDIMRRRQCMSTRTFPSSPSEIPSELSSSHFRRERTPRHARSQIRRRRSSASWNYTHVYSPRSVTTKCTTTKSESKVVSNSRLTVGYSNTNTHLISPQV